jgi:CelD/BcsL family acetyltransferase involved in cellulose biosynthesis
VTPPTGDTLTVRECRDLARHRDAWDALVDGLPVPTPFLKTWWLDAVADEHTRYVVVLDEEDRLLGGLATAVRRVPGLRVVRFAGDGPLCPDHLDLVCGRGEAAVVAAVERWLAAEPTLLELSGLCEESQAEKAWGPGRDQAIAPFRLLQAPEAYSEGLSTSQRRALRRADRRLTALANAWEVVRPQGLDAAMADFRRLTAERPGREHLLGALPELDAAVRAGVDRGEARVDVLSGPAGTIAVMISFVTGRRLSMYQIARSLEREASGAGNVLLDRVFAAAAAEGATEIDMLRGDEAYKYKFVDRQRRVRRLRRGFGARARAVAGLWNALEELRRMLEPVRQWVSAPRRRRPRRASP